jgi:hypothetical protein
LPQSVISMLLNVECTKCARKGRRPIKVADRCTSNKIARMAWAMMVRGERFKEPKLLPAA